MVRILPRTMLASLLLLAGLTAAHWAAAAELRLRAEAKSAGSLVTLGDLAEIIATDPHQAQTLAAIELFPAPSGGEPRYVRLREIQDLLLLRGVNLAEHQFSGSSQVTVMGSPRAAAARPAPSVSDAALHRIQRRLAESITKYLEEHVSTQQAWSVDADISDEQARQLADPTQKIRVAGGCAPWTGPQRFEITLRNPALCAMSTASSVSVSVPI